MGENEMGANAIYTNEIVEMGTIEIDSNESPSLTNTKGMTSVLDEYISIYCSSNTKKSTTPENNSITKSIASLENENNIKFIVDDVSCTHDNSIYSNEINIIVDNLSDENRVSIYEIII
jgi:hypothetical protein